MFQRFLDLFKPRIKTVQQLADRIGKGNFEKLGEWLEWNIWYNYDRDKKDEWKPAQRTLNERKGDCEDFAILAYSVLKLWDVKDVKIIGAYPFSGNQRGHAVCCFKDLGIWYYYSNGEMYGSWSSFDKMTQKIVDDCHFTVVGIIREHGIFGDVYS